MTRRRAIITTAFITVLSALLVQFGYSHLALPNFPLNSAVEPGFYRVVKVSDGDTITVDMNGTQESVRFIGVDTPETHKPNAPVQCFGPQASDFTTTTLRGASVRLEADPTNDNRDRYDRLLRYVYLKDGSLLSKTLIEQGYGFAYTSFPFTKKAEFIETQARAKAEKRGLWASCQPRQEASGRWQNPNL